MVSYLRFYYGLKKQGISRDSHPYKAPFQPWLCKSKLFPPPATFLPTSPFPLFSSLIALNANKVSMVRTCLVHNYHTVLRL